MTESQTTSSTDILMNLIVALLAPMFIQAADGDMNFARAAAAGTVNEYRARNHIDLLAIAQIIGFGLAALGSLGLSMTDNISISTTLRLRAGAVASNRAAEACRRALAKSRLSSEPAITNNGNGLFFQEPVSAPPSVQPTCSRAGSTESSNTHPGSTQEGDMQQRQSPPATIQPTSATADTQPVPAQPVPAQPVPAQPVPAQQTNIQLAPGGTISAHSGRAQPPQPPAQPAVPPLLFGAMSGSGQNRALWATAMSSVAADVTASLPHLPAAERRVASVRAIALSTVARDLLTDSNAQPRPAFALPR